jgi:hypothetical protein
MRSSGIALALCLAGVAGAPGLARADPGAPESRLSRITVFGDLGYAYPIGTAERGTDTRDVSFGLIPLSVRGVYDLAGDWNASARLRYALGIPTLCASGPDCESSLGRDVAVSIGVGRALRRWRGFTAHVGLEIGWEWLTTRLSDSGVTASRGWNGPIATLEIFLDLKSRGPWSLGPALGVDAGFFSHFDLETPAGQAGGSTDAAIHAWPTISFRVGRRL